MYAKSLAAPGRTRRASVAVEMLVLLPVMLFLTLAVVEYSLLLSARERLAVACREGARVAALGGDDSAVCEAVRRHLGGGRFEDARIEAQLLDEAGQPRHSGEPVGVRVSLAANEAAPDALGFIGLGTRDETLVAETVLRKE